MAHLSTLGKQLIRSYSADQNQAMLYNIHLSDNISVVGPSVLPSGNHISGQTYTLDSHQKNKKSTQNVGSVKKKDVEGELGWSSAQMLLVYVVQRNVKERIADSPLILFEGPEC